MRIKKDSIIEILAVGSEFLTPHFQDTNSLYLTQRINDLGLDVDFKTIVGDQWENLIIAFRQALSRSKLIISPTLRSYSATHRSVSPLNIGICFGILYAS